MEGVALINSDIDRSDQVRQQHTDAQDVKPGSVKFRWRVPDASENYHQNVAQTGKHQGSAFSCQEWNRLWLLRKREGWVCPSLWVVVSGSLGLSMACFILYRFIELGIKYWRQNSLSELNTWIWSRVEINKSKGFPITVWWYRCCQVASSVGLFYMYSYPDAD